MNSSLMMGTMNASLYLDSTGGGSFGNQSRSVQQPAAAIGSKGKFVRFQNSTQTGKNISKVRWLVEDNYFSVPDPFATEYFVSGSWSWVGEENEINLWSLEVGPSSKDGEKQAKVNFLNKVPIRASVTGITALSDGKFCACTSDGALYTLSCRKTDDGNYDQLVQTACKQFFNHRGINSPATAIASRDNFIVTAGEDGSIYECSPSLIIHRHLEKVDPLSISSICMISRSEVLTGNGGGQLKLWDLRNDSMEPVQILNPNVLMNNLYGVSSICQHPTQTHAIIVGYQSGCMDLWDMRMGPDCDPVANLAGEGGSLTEMYFHQVNPDHFFSCAQSGQVSHWYPADRLSNPLQMPVEYTTDLNIEFLKRGLVFKEIHTSPFPINSISLSKNDRLVVGSDSGVVFCTEVRV